MNKATKSAIAAGAAGILLLGGAGTFALWQDTDAVDPASISTGVLTLGVGTGTWHDVTGGTKVDIPDIGGFGMVPGDTITYTTPVTIEAEGKNLRGGLEINKAALDASALNTADYLNVTVSSVAETEGLLVDETTGVFTFADPGTYNLNVTITVEFEHVEGLDAQNENLVGQNKDLNLAALALTLKQA